MNRLEYLTQLRRLLEDGGLAEDEINDAMGFYEEIFLDAGAAHEAETAANLGSPEELANKILQDSGIQPFRSVLCFPILPVKNYRLKTRPVSFW